MKSTASIPAGSLRIPCGIVAPDDEIPKIRYALDALLVPLGLDPEWTDPASGAEVAGPGIVYAAADFQAPPGWLSLARNGFGRPEPVPDEPWDPVATAWWWLSGDAETSVKSRDRFGRFAFAGSWHERWSLGARAPVDEARDRLAAALNSAGFELRPRRWEGRAWALCPTHDVDYVRKMRAGILWRETIEHLALDRRREPLSLRLGRFARFATGAIPGRDPYRSALSRILETHRVSGATATWFFKAGTHGPHDVSYGLRSGALSRFFRDLRGGGHEIGLHPGFHAYAHDGYVADEMDRLDRACGEFPRAVRMHYLRWHEHSTPQIMAQAGFRVDSTLGFPDAPGFRRGTCLPFRLWDPVLGAPSDLWEMPLAVMESALFNRLGLDTVAAFEQTSALMDTCRRHGGALVALWHNTLWDEDDSPGWGEHFTRTLDRARAEGATIRSLSSALDAWRPGPG